MKIFVNSPSILSFDDAISASATEELALKASDLDGNSLVSLRYVKYQNVHSIQVNYLPLFQSDIQFCRFLLLTIKTKRKKLVFPSSNSLVFQSRPQKWVISTSNKNKVLMTANVSHCMVLIRLRLIIWLRLLTSMALLLPLTVYVEEFTPVLSIKSATKISSKNLVDSLMTNWVEEDRNQRFLPGGNGCTNNWDSSVLWDKM